MTAPRKLTIDQYFELFEGNSDGSKIEFYGDEMWIGNEPFYDLVVRYLAMIGQVAVDDPPSASERPGRRRPDPDPLIAELEKADDDDEA